MLKVKWLQMENQSEDVPLGQIKIGVTYNLKHAETTVGNAPDEQAEYDSLDTVLAIESAIRKFGHKDGFAGSGRNATAKAAARKARSGINIAEGRGGRAREAQVPALLNLFTIPFTGSDETTLCLSLDKALTKRVLSTYQIPTPRYRLFSPGEPFHTSGLSFPVIVKPNAEGSSKGIADVCIAKTSAELKSLVQQNFALYGGAVLAEEFISGREFTVGLVGNGDTVRVFPPMEIVYHKSPIEGYNVYNYT
jgi:D-alanine-D-alanine ligase